MAIYIAYIIRSSISGAESLRLCFSQKRILVQSKSLDSAGLLTPRVVAAPQELHVRSWYYYKSRCRCSMSPCTNAIVPLPGFLACERSGCHMPWATSRNITVADWTSMFVFRAILGGFKESRIHLMRCNLHVQGFYFREGSHFLRALHHVLLINFWSLYVGPFWNVEGLNRVKIFPNSDWQTLPFYFHRLLFPCVLSKFSLYVVSIHEVLHYCCGFNCLLFLLEWIWHLWVYHWLMKRFQVLARGTRAQDDWFTFKRRGCDILVLLHETFLYGGMVPRAVQKLRYSPIDRIMNWKISLVYHKQHIWYG